VATTAESRYIINEVVVLILKEKYMFEDQLQAVKELLETDEQFRDLHDQYQAIKNKVDTSGRTLDKFNLDKLKKEKLLLKDQLATILNQHTA
jgi:uncharacterized protein YdcH (DUF465 family)